MFAQSALNLARNFFRDLALHHQHILGLTVILPRPEVCLILHLNQLGGNSHGAGIASYTPLEHVLHFEFMCDLLQRLLVALVLHHRSAGDHA